MNDLPQPRARLEQVASAYDALAPSYDDALASNPVAVWMRAQLWTHYRRVFRPDARLLDFGAGTGADALYLGLRGAQVVALDVSAGMIAEIQRRAAELGVQVDGRVLSAEALDELPAGSFDGALSAFAVLNTIEDLPNLSMNLVRVLKPHGRVILHALSKFCLWEQVNLLMHGHLPRARKPDMDLGGQRITLRFHDPFVLYREAFAEKFELRQVYGLSVIAAPTWVKRVPRLAPIVLKVDELVGRALPNCGDFFVIDMELRGDR